MGVPLLCLLNLAGISQNGHRVHQLVHCSFLVCVAETVGYVTFVSGSPAPHPTALIVPEVDLHRMPHKERLLTAANRHTEGVRFVGSIPTLLS